MRAILVGAGVLIVSVGCGSQAPPAAKPIPPTPTVDQFQGVTTEAPLKPPRPSTEQR